MNAVLSFSSAAFDDDEVFRVELTPAILRAVIRMTILHERCCDGSIEVLDDDASLPLTPPAAFEEWVENELAGEE
jgi:hypothetical protein